jgi:hypothetical protein
LKNKKMKKLIKKGKIIMGRREGGKNENKQYI